jgi:branched-chain amino acid transport system ATP-binding protein
MNPVALSTRGLTKRFGGLLVSDAIDLEVQRGELHAIIGPNGAGKTTLINQLIGEVLPDAGKIDFEGKDITSVPSYQRALMGLARTYQITSILQDFSALENVALAAQAHSGHSFGVWRPAARDQALNDRSLQTLKEVGLSGKAHVIAGEFSHGEHRQLELAMALVTRPKALLLDEPMAGMGSVESASMMALLASFKGRYTMVLIEHDMDVVFALADRITVLVYGKAIACGAPAEIRASREVKRAYLGERYAQG